MLFSSMGTILGGWFGAFPIPLDWDRPWQVWPISCTIGAIMGYFLGIIISMLINFGGLVEEKKEKI